MLSEIEKCIRFLFGRWVEESDVRHISKILYRAMVKKNKQTGGGNSERTA